MTVKSLLVPRSVDEAVQFMDEYGSDLVVMGGGTIIMGQVNEGTLFPAIAMSLAGAGLGGVREVDGHVEIGAATTAAQLAGLTVLPPLAEAAGILGGPALRNAATVGGNLWARAPYGDLAVPLLALDADVEVVGPQGGKRLSLEEFLMRRTAPLGHPGEIVTTVHVPRPWGRTAYLKLGRRHGNTPSVVAVSVQVSANGDGTVGDARVALGAAAPYAMRARRAESAIEGRALDDEAISAAVQAAMEECQPFTDALATDWYRRKMVGVYVKRALDQVVSSGF